MGVAAGTAAADTVVVAGAEAVALAVAEGLAGLEAEVPGVAAPAEAGSGKGEDLWKRKQAFRKN